MTAHSSLRAMTRALGAHESARPIDGPSELRYVQMKREWKAAHRGATAEEYNAAIRLIVAECGV